MELENYTLYLNYNEKIITYADSLAKLNGKYFSSLDDYLHYILATIIDYRDPNEKPVLEHPNKVGKSSLEKAIGLSLNAPRCTPLRSRRTEHKILLDEAEMKAVDFLSENTFWSFDLIADYVIYKIIRGFNNITLPFSDRERIDISSWNRARVTNASHDKSAEKG